MSEAEARVKESEENREESGVDINDPEILNSVIKGVDSTADATKPLSPPPTGDYIVRWELGKQGVYARRQSPAKSTFDKVNGDPYLVAHLVGHVEAEGTPYNNTRVETWEHTIPNRDGASGLHTFMMFLGSPLEDDWSLGRIKEVVEGTLRNTPRGKARLDWEASYATGEKKPGTDKNDYRSALKGMRNFPGKKDKDGNRVEGVHEHIIPHPQQVGSEIAAKAFVDKHLPS